MTNLLRQIDNYIPCNEQEARDKEQMLAFMKSNPDCLDRKNEIGHFTASVWVVDRTRKKTLMVYHNLYDSWSWIGGHADGEEDLCAVALRELSEETGVKHARLISSEIFSLETLTVDGHIKRGNYVPSHLHFNVTYLAEADEEEMLVINEAENKGVKWWTFAEALTASTEPWMVEHVYKNLSRNVKAGREIYALFFLRQRQKRGIVITYTLKLGDLPPFLDRTGWRVR